MDARGNEAKAIRNQQVAGSSPAVGSSQSPREAGGEEAVITPEAERTLVAWRSGQCDEADAATHSVDFFDARHFALPRVRQSPA